MRPGLGRAAEAHALADVVAALVAEEALLAGQTDLERDVVADLEVGHACADGRDDAGRLVAQGQGLADDDVAIAVVVEVVQVGAAKARGLYGDLDLVAGRCRQDALFLEGSSQRQNSRLRGEVVLYHSEILRAVQHRGKDLGFGHCGGGCAVHLG